MNDLIKCIIEKNFTEAERLFNERIEAIAESKMVEKKKMIAAKDYLLDEARLPPQTIKSKAHEHIAAFKRAGNDAAALKAAAENAVSNLTHTDLNRVAERLSHSAEEILYQAKKASRGKVDKK